MPQKKISEVIQMQLWCLPKLQKDSISITKEVLKLVYERCKEEIGDLESVMKVVKQICEQ